MRVLNCEQRSEEWFEARATMPAASEFSRILSNTGKPSKSADGYANELIARQLWGASSGFQGNQWTERGNELESEARAYYEFLSGNAVEQVGFCVHDLQCGCSPDGLIGEDGGLEIKCPAPKTHVEYLLQDKVPTDYLAQIQGSLFITGRKWWDFLSYCPGAPALLRRVEPDLEWHAAFAVELEKFHALVASKLARLQELGYAIS